MKKLTATLLLSVAAIAAVSGSAMAADLMAPAAAPVVSAPASTNWDGPYIGASVGYSWGSAEDTTNTNGTANFSGVFAGIEAGYNFHLSDNIVLGIQGDINWSNEHADTFTSSTAETFRINWDGAVVGRLGYDAGDFLPYVEAGVAFANATLTYNGTDYSATQTGWTAGVGVQFKLADQLSANLEYRYSDYGTGGPYYSGTEQIHLTDNSIRIGLDYHLQ